MSLTFKDDVKKFMQLCDVNNDGKIEEEEFVEVVLEAQKKGGQGDWKEWTRSQILPFRYKHLGGYEYVGYDSSITYRGSAGKR